MGGLVVLVLDHSITRPPDCDCRFPSFGVGCNGVALVRVGCTDRARLSSAHLILSAGLVRRPPWRRGPPGGPTRSQQRQGLPLRTRSKAAPPAVAPLLETCQWCA